MRALIRRDGGVHIDDVAIPGCTRSDDVRVRVDVAGLCRTDIYVAQGKLPVREPLILGHEFMGTVMEGGADGFSVGDQVTAIPLLACGECRACAASRPCTQARFLGIDLDGAFADHIVVPAQYLRRIPKGTEPRHAAYTEPVAAALAVLNAPLPSDGPGVVLGMNRIGALTERILANAGFRDVVRMSPDQGTDLVNEAAFVIETEANEKSLQVMFELLRPGGVAILKSRPAMPVPLNVALAVKKDIQLFGVSYGSFDEAIRLIASDDLGLDDFLGPAFALEDFETAFEASADGAATKTFFHINGD